MKLKDIRSTFLNYFANQNHEIIPSSSLVPHNDPTLMFVNAGMNQFKDVFTGKDSRNYSRAVTSQKCVRAGGKHNDLDNVGYTARHHTFFEMMGNFSFGDYFKEQAIAYAWELITKEYAIPAEKLLVTVYSEDTESADLWKKIAGLSSDKIIKIATLDNFWSMGDTGPCGPCTEIFYDHGESIPGGPPGSADEDGDRFVEIWNLVFMQYEQLSAEKRIELPKKSIDTGMGLERMATVLQGKQNNYDIDLFQNLIKASADLTNVDPQGEKIVSHRVVADHLRSSCFLLADGVLPSNEGRGYVLRRIMRRGMRHAHLLGAEEPLMYRLVPALIHEMGEDYPELKRAQALITQTLELEEKKFCKTLRKGLQLLEQETEKLGDKEPLAGDVAFKLYDTYGFPLDLTEDVLRGQNRCVDKQGFDQLMEAQKAKARESWLGSGQSATDDIWFGIKERVGSTEFLGYSHYKNEALVQALVQDGQEVKSLDKGDTGFVIVNQTVFYAESGGQSGDQGVIHSKQGALLKVLDTQKQAGGVFTHHVRVEKGAVSVHDGVLLSFDQQRRNDTRANHSAVHLLHESLRRLLGKHVTQKGSMVNAERWRFDISHPKSLTAEEIIELERMVNERIRNNTPVHTKLMDQQEAIESGALAMFGEKYDSEVRVLSMGGDDIAEAGRSAYSVELCGGTHVDRTGDIGLFKITAESAIAAGVRRLEGVTGRAALHYIQNREAILLESSQLMKISVESITERIATLLSERKKAEKEIADLRKKIVLGSGIGGSDTEIKNIDGIEFIGQIINGLAAKDLMPMANTLKKKIKSGVVTLISINEEGKASVVVTLTADLTDQLNAVDLVKLAAETLGGKGGGGRIDMAQSGGPNGQAANDALKVIEKRLVL